MSPRKYTVKGWIDDHWRPVTRGLARMGLSPNLVTGMGVVVSLMVPYELLQDRSVAAGLWLFACGFFDVLDGSIARNEKLRTSFGAFWDSTLDRFSEAVVFGGFVLYYSRHSDETGVLLSFSVFTLSLLVSYTRARAEGLGIECEVGVLPRTGRILMLIAGLLFHQLIPVLWLIGFFSLITVGQRVHRVWVSLKTRKKR
ncbi:MAG TPA: CDP-alcohol phosphatidyltransferase family protein [bacterium]|nr:CDP-alcohol phosphatidyltransferase family protein [bacterium]